MAVVSRHRTAILAGGLVTIMREQENAPHDPAGLNRIMD
jgi:hypothetical protein